MDIVTVEDPVESRLAGVNPAPGKQKQGLPLADMGVWRAWLSALTAQRLVRKLCPLWAAEPPEGEADRDVPSALAENGSPKSVFLAAGRGNREGFVYAGRTTIVEGRRITEVMPGLVNSCAAAAC